MKKALKTSLVALGLLAFGFTITSKVSARDALETQNGDVNLVVTAGDLTILTSGASINLGSVSSTSEDQVLSGQFENVDCFRVSDLKGAASGYYTTIQVTDLTGTINGETKTISSGNVQFRAGQDTPHKISGEDNTGVVFNTTIKTDTTINTPVQYIKRDNYGGILGEYGDTPRVTVTVPAYTPATNYHGVITYTLYENE